MRILLVEDEPDLLRSLAQALREEGYAVDTAADGDEGLFKAEGSDYDALVLDVMLPRMDGWQVLARLRRSRRTPVLMLTARDAGSDRVRGFDLGADDYLVKPFDLAELFARLRALIRRSAGQTRSAPELGDVVINTAARSVLHEEVGVELTAREYALVEFLAVHRGEVVTRTALYEHLFDEDDRSLSNLLDVHVSNVRKKLGHDFITTRRGHGYCIGDGHGNWNRGGRFASGVPAFLPGRQRPDRRGGTIGPGFGHRRVNRPRPSGSHYRFQHGGGGFPVYGPSSCRGVARESRPGTRATGCPAQIFPAVNARPLALPLPAGILGKTSGGFAVHASAAGAKA